MTDVPANSWGVVTMAIPPVPDYEQDLGRLALRLGRSVDVLNKLSFALVILLAVIVAGGIGVLVQLNRVGDRLDNVERRLLEVKDGQAGLASALSRSEQHPDPQASTRPLALSADDARTLKSMLKFNGEFYRGVGYVGEILTDTKLYDFPTEILIKLPVLRGSQYTVDIKGQILITSQSNHQVLAIV